MLCPKCGMQIKDDDVFCAYCGETITQGAPGNAPVQPPQYAAPAEPVPPPPPPYNAPPPEVPSYPQPAPYPARQPAPGGGKKGGLIAIIIALSVLLAAALGIMIFLLAKKNGGGSSSDSASDNAVVTTASDEQTATTTKKRTTVTTEPETEEETEPDTEAETTTTTTTTTTTVPETTTKVTTLKQAALSDDAAAQAEASFYSTRDLPTADEFDWCAGQFGLIKEAPGYAERITNPLAITGGWKAMLIYENASNPDYIDREIDNFEIFLEGNRATVSIDWYLALPAYSEMYYIDESDTIITQLHGAVTGMSIDATGSIANGTLTLRIDDFWRADGKQYAVGTMYIPNGKTAYVALVRK